MTRQFAQRLICGVVTAVAACKTASTATHTLDADIPIAGPAAAVVISFDAARPLAGVLSGAGGFAPGDCFPGTSAQWSDPQASAIQSPELVPPGTLRLVTADHASSANSKWTAERSDAIQGLTVFNTAADSFSDLLNSFASADPAAVNWHLERAFGQALFAALKNAPPAQAHYGVVSMTRTLANQALSSPAPTPSGVTVTSGSYAVCGDGYLSGQVLSDNLFVLTATSDGASRDQVVGAMRQLALAHGELDSTLKAAADALSAGTLWVLEPTASGAQLTVHDVGDAESAMHDWRDNNNAARGVKSLLGIVTPYPQYAAAPDPTRAQTNTALNSLAIGRNALRGLSAEAASTGATALDAIEAAIDACGAERFTAACTQLNAQQTPIFDIAGLAACSQAGTARSYVMNDGCRAGVLVQERVRTDGGADFIYYFDGGAYNAPYLENWQLPAAFETHPLARFYAVGGWPNDPYPTATMTRLRDISFPGPPGRTGTWSNHALCADVDGVVCPTDGASVEDALYVFKVKPAIVPDDQLVQLFFWQTSNRKLSPDAPPSSWPGGMVAATPCSCDATSDAACKWFLDRNFQCKAQVGWAYKS